MGQIHIDNVTEGMTLAADVLDLDGRLLLGEGSVITRRHIRMFISWGVTVVDIEGVDPQEWHQLQPVQIDPERLRMAEAELAPLFRNVNLAHPAMAELFRLCRLRKAQDEKA